MKKLIADVTDFELFQELNNCKIAKALLSKSTYKKQWLNYENAIKDEINLRNKEFIKMSDDELLAELGE